MSRKTWLFGLALAGACTAPPRPDPAPVVAPAPPPRVRVHLDAPGLATAELEALAAPLLESAFARDPAVTALATRVDDGRVDLIATLSSPAALDSLRSGLAPLLPQLPAGTPPTFIRADDTAPVFALALPSEGPADIVVATLERTPGVARVDVCGGSERVLRVDLDRPRLAGVPIDRVIHALTTEPARDLPAPDRLLARTIASTDRSLRDIAIVRETARPRPCAAFTARGPVLLLTVFAQIGADPAQVAADASAHAVDLVSPPKDFFADALPTPDASTLVVLGLELSREDSAPAHLVRCLGAADLPAWALLAPQPDPTEPVRRARLLLAGAPALPLEPVLSDLSRCPDVKRAAVLAPAALADHAMSVILVGAEPTVLTELAELAAARLAAVPGLTGLQLFAPRPRPAPLELDRDALRAHDLAPADIARAVALAHGPLPLASPPRAGAPLRVELDLPDRTGTLEQLLGELHVHTTTGSLALAGLVRASTRPPELAPRYRFDQQPGVALDLRLRRASDRELVQKALAEHLALPAGVVLTLNPGLPAFDP